MSFTQKRIQKQTSFVKFFLIIPVIIIGIAFYMYNSFSTAPLVKETREIIIKDGKSFSSLGETIFELDNIWYKIYLQTHTPDFSLAKGKYKLEKGKNLSAIFESLQKPILNEMNITILEGWNMYDIDLNLTKKGLIEKGEYITYVTSQEKIKKIQELNPPFPFLQDIKLESLEGYLYPETYKINPQEFSINILILAQLNQFEKRVYDKIFKGKIKNNDIYDVINLAAIVEREEKVGANKKTVAGILKKRLNKNWMIGADASVCYPYKITSAECTQKFIDTHVFEKNEYNTRTMMGLPKTPIGNPSHETLEATLNDAKTDYWYYIHNMKTGKIYYGKTEAEHTYNIKNNMR